MQIMVVNTRVTLSAGLFSVCSVCCGTLSLAGHIGLSYLSHREVRYVLTQWIVLRDCLTLCSCQEAFLLRFGSLMWK